MTTRTRDKTDTPDTPGTLGKLDKADQAEKAEKATPSQILKDLRHLLKASEDFVDQMNRQAMDAQTGEKLAELLRVRRYLENVADHVAEVFTLPQDLASQHPVGVSDASYLSALGQLLESLGQRSTQSSMQPITQAATESATQLTTQPTTQPANRSDHEAGAGEFAAPGSDIAPQQLYDAFERAYQDLKVQLLHAGANGQWPLVAMEQGLQRISAQRRAVQQLLKARRWLDRAIDESPAVSGAHTG